MTNACYRQPQRAGHEPVCLVPDWTSICLCLSGVFAQASPHILRASYSSDIGLIDRLIVQLIDQLTGWCLVDGNAPETHS